MATSRRELLQVSVGAAGLAALAAKAMAQQSGGGIATRRLGRTDEQVGIIGIGGAHLSAVGSKDESLATRMAHTAIDAGMNFFDNAWAYGQEGFAEELMGRTINGKRHQVFLMTKNSGRDYKFAKQCVDDSLQRFQTDYLDLAQFHETNYDNDPDWIFERGALRAVLEAQKEGKIRHIGFTGHKHPSIHLKMLNKPYDWATAQMPINPLDYFYRSFSKRVIPVCLAMDVGVIGMKNLGGGGTAEGTGASVGRIPRDTKITAEQCVRFGLSLPVSTIVRGYTTMEQLEADIAIARDFKPMLEEEKKELFPIAAVEGGDGRHEIFKSTQYFDNPLYQKMHGFSGVRCGA